METQKITAEKTEPQEKTAEKPEIQNAEREEEAAAARHPLFEVKTANAAPKAFETKKIKKKTGASAEKGA